MWNEEQEQFLLNNYKTMTRAKMAESLGRSRNSVCGKMDRMKKRGLIDNIPDEVKFTPKPLPKPAKIKTEQGNVHLSILEKNQCHWPCNGLIYCGEPSMKDYGYCDKHFKRMWNAGKTNKKNKDIQEASYKVRVRAEP